MRAFLIILFTVLLVAVAGVYLYIGTIAEGAIEFYGTQALGVQVKVGSVRLSPKFDSITISRLSIANPQGYNSKHAIEVGNIHVALNLKSIFNPPLNIHNLHVNSLIINYEVNGNTNNIKVIKANVDKAHANAEQTPDKTDKSKDMKVMIGKFILEDTKADIQIENVVKKEVSIPNITIENIGVGSGGVRIEDALDQIFTALVDAITRANLETIVQELLKVNVDHLKDTILNNDAIKGSVEGVSNAIGKMFGK